MYKFSYLYGLCEFSKKTICIICLSKPHKSQILKNNTISKVLFQSFEFVKPGYY